MERVSEKSNATFGAGERGVGVEGVGGDREGEVIKVNSNILNTAMSEQENDKFGSGGRGVGLEGVVWANINIVFKHR